MAAILCNGIGDFMHVVCRGLEQVLCLPCRMCGCVCDNLCDIITSPFFFFLAVALGTNIPPIWGGIQAHQLWGGQAMDNDCGRGVSWLLINALLCLANIFAALYLVHAITRTRRFRNEEPLYHEMRDAKEMSIKRVSQVLCYDPCFALYLIVFIFFLIWQSIGISRVVAMRGDDCQEGIRSKSILALICGHLFLTLTAMAFICSMCCMKVQNTLPR
jgi:hypothetical protein